MSQSDKVQLLQVWRPEYTSHLPYTTEQYGWLWWSHVSWVETHWPPHVMSWSSTHKVLALHFPWTGSSAVSKSLHQRNQLLHLIKVVFDKPQNSGFAWKNVYKNLDDFQLRQKIIWLIPSSFLVDTCQPVCVVWHALTGYCMVWNRACSFLFYN